MKGAIIGDMVGSGYDEKNIKTKEFNLFDLKNHMTDDSLLTIEVAKVLMKHSPLTSDNKTLKSIQETLVTRFSEICRANPDIGWGASFFDWAHQQKGNQRPYDSYGNGGAMRVSPVAWAAKSIDEVKILCKTVTEITHNHSEGLKGAEAIAVTVYLARTGSSKEEIAEYIYKHYYPEIVKLDYKELVKTYTFNVTAQGSVPQAIYCFLISKNFPDALRTAVSIGGDSDTIAAMTGAIAEAYYERIKPSRFIERFTYLFIDKELEELIKNFYKTFE